MSDYRCCPTCGLTASTDTTSERIRRRAHGVRIGITLLLLVVVTQAAWLSLIAAGAVGP